MERETTDDVRACLVKHESVAQEQTSVLYSVWRPCAQWHWR